jgi:ubiquinone/menaquinone biosynthesis C-methylase UbiE
VTDPTLDREREFWNQKQRQFRRVRRWIDRSIGEFARWDDMHDYYDARDKVVLDYGCGPGLLSVRLAQEGAREVVGVDLSERQLDEARSHAQAQGVGDRTRFQVADAHETGFPDATFDLAVGVSILHHLDVERALRELRRILKPGGKAVFAEPLAHNVILRVGRALTPSARTEDEHPLTTRDWETCASIFPNFSHHERELVTLPLMPLNLVLPRSWQRRLAPRLHATDRRLLATWPGLSKYARLTILVLE